MDISNMLSTESTSMDICFLFLKVRRYLPKNWPKTCGNLWFPSSQIFSHPIHLPSTPEFPNAGGAAVARNWRW
jgi:hypothetical protein